MILRKGEKLSFADAVNKRWHVHRDECQDEFIRLRGRHAQKLRNSRGLDHLYIIGPAKLGLWITSDAPNRTFNVMRGKVPSLAMELHGKGEAVFSCHISDLDKLCAAAHALARRQLSEKEEIRRRKRGDNLQESYSHGQQARLRRQIERKMEKGTVAPSNSIQTIMA